MGVNNGDENLVTQYKSDRRAWDEERKGNFLDNFTSGLILFFFALLLN
jgi:hypothetical protein